MKKIALVLGLLLFHGLIKAQPPVHWSYHITRKDSLMYALTFTALLQKGWYLYSSEDRSISQFAPRFHFKSRSGVQLIPPLKEEGIKILRYDPILEKELECYTGKVVFVQHLKVIPGERSQMHGMIEFVAGAENDWLPRQVVPFAITLE